jgi:FkbM family methyltransferase
MRRIGSEYGGWWLPEWVLTCKTLNVLSAGAGEDITFEVGLLKTTNHSILVVDPTPRAIKHYQEFIYQMEHASPFPVNNDQNMYYDQVSKKDLARLRYEPVGLWSENVKQFFSEPSNPRHVSHSLINLQATESGFESNCRKVSSIASSNGIERFDIVKLDIEGAEYDVIGNILEDRCLPAILCCEFHSNDITLSRGYDIEHTLGLLYDAGYALLKREDKNYTLENNNLSKVLRSKSN